MIPIKIEIELDGTGVYYNAAEPIMLDGLLCSALCRWHSHGEPPARDDDPIDIPLPLARWFHGGMWGWRASALFPVDPQGGQIVFWRKRLRQNRIEITTGSPNANMGTYRDWNMPLSLTLVTKLVAYAVGNGCEVKRELRRNIKYIGKKRAHGRGRVIGINVEHCEHDLSLSHEGRAMRWLPSSSGTRMVRLRPPYWCSARRVRVCEIGDQIDLSGFGNG